MPPTKTTPPRCHAGERIVALQPERGRRGTANSGLGLQDEGRLAEAAACYGRALELQPEHLDALMNQGELHEELGELAQAEAYYRRAQSTHPWPGPLARLATLLRGRAARTPTGKPSRRGCTSPVPSRRAAPCSLAWPTSCDARGDYAEAAACLDQANALALEHNRKQGRHYDPDGTRAWSIA